MASPTALVPLEKLQFGVETTPGTLVAADTIFLAEDGGAWTPEIERQEIDEQRGVLGMVEDVVVRKGSLLSTAGVLDFEQILLPLATGLAELSTAGVGPYTHTVEPSMTNPDTLKAATWEIAYRDGSNKRVEREFGYSQCRRFGIELAFNQPARLTAEYFGRADQTSTNTNSLSALSREVIASNLFNVYIDDSWASLGSNHVTNLVRSATLEIVTGVEPMPAVDSLTDLDYDTIQRGFIGGSLQLTCAVQADATAELAKWRSGDLRFVQLKALGSSSRSLKANLSGRYSAVSFGRDGNLRTMTLTMPLRYDPTSGKIVGFEVINALAGI